MNNTVSIVVMPAAIIVDEYSTVTDMEAPIMYVNSFFMSRVIELERVVHAIPFYVFWE